MFGFHNVNQGPHSSRGGGSGIITDAQLLEVSGNVHVDGTDIGSSDHLLVWMELGRASKTSKKRKRGLEDGV